HYQWRENTGSGAVPIPGANSTNLVVDTSDTFGTWIYDLVVTNNLGSTTSAPVTLVVLEANPPVVTADITPRPVTRYQGQEVTFTAAFDGTQPITYQWRNFNGDIPGATNTTLTLTNLQLSDTEEYWLVASNAVGTAETSVSSLTVLLAPPPPAPGTFGHAIRTNGPMAYWRLNDPAGTELLHDSAGTHNQLNQNVTLGVPGLRAPAYPGFPADNTASSFTGNSAATGTASLNGLSSFTVMGWFNPGGANGPFAGLFGQNDLFEVGYSDGAGVNLWIQLNGIWTNPRTGTNSFEVGQWYFVAIVADGTSVDVYVNGVQRAHETGGAPSATSGFGFNIGGGGIFGSSGDYFNGLIEDVAIFDRAFSQAQIQDLYGVGVGLVAPTILVQPTSQRLYFGRTARFTASGLGGTQPLAYQWQHTGVNLNNGGNISGATSPSLMINNAGAGNVGDYRLIVSNAAGATTSSVVSLTLVQPGTPYETTSIALNPLAYWRLNDLADPASGSALAADYWGGFAGTYGATAQSGFNGIAGPRPVAGFNAFEASNTAAQFAGGTPDSYVAVPALNLNTNAVSFTMWIHPNGAQPDYAGLFFTRSGTSGGVGYGGDFSGNRGQLGYTWNNNTTWEFQSGLMVLEGKWSFAAVVIEATQARLYLFYKDANGADVLLSTNNPIAHTSEAWNGDARIGRDPGHDDRIFNGIIDEVAVFNRALTPTQVLNLYQAGDTPAVRLTIERAAPNLRLSWPQGTLQEALSVSGPWTNNPASSPYVFPPAGLQKFYRVLVSP
ncbi:MAG TPA: LamG-like jellyroll fold domain-containing protein, partial [Bryobacteraceae bacterium]|nr:LamG-like jellyroll fold domain-containing protein [Bryobacteraceae bacterium]